ncbi:MAG: NUDIX hydrolase N-terminal domain-containing protein [Ktedonobacteraceae bacterium]|nr:NUDIX hydrolase N-terminal domain-containing protein [Ktedonobacteraceae bacterium]
MQSTTIYCSSCGAENQLQAAFCFSCGQKMLVGTFPPSLMQDQPQQALAKKIALSADILRDCSARGLHYTTNVYDRDNYQKVQDIALELFTLASGRLPIEIEPLRSSIFTRPAPIPTGDGAVIDAIRRILLIRRADNDLWAMPGGGLEVGETPAQGVIREVLEETGVTCEPVALVGIYDSRLCGTSSLSQLYQFSFLCRLLLDIKVIDPPPHAHEILEQNWFLEDALPNELDPGHVRRIPEAFRVWHGDLRAFFDQIDLPRG